MKPSAASVLVLAALVAGCNESTNETESKKPVDVAHPNPSRSGAPGSHEPTPGTKPALPVVPALTDDSARKILHAPLEAVGGDELSRQALLYLADIGDKDGADAARKMLETKDGKFEDKTAAAVALEALLVYGEPGAGAKTVALAKQYAADDEQPDEWLVHALGRVPAGPDRAAATAELLKIAAPDVEASDIGDTATLAMDALARMAAPEARETFAKTAADPKLGGQIRGAAVAGLLRLSDPRGKAIGEKIVAASTAEAPEDATKKPDGKPEAKKPDAETPDPPLPEDVIAGLGVEGATDAAPLIQKTLDVLLAQEGNAVMLESSAAVSAFARIFAKGGGQELFPWLREFAKKVDAFHEDEAALALWALGDETSSTAVAEQLRGSVSAWASPNNMEPAIEILDIAARRGVARAAAFRTIVDAAAQVGVADSKHAGGDYNLRLLNVAAAHAFLKSAAK